MRVYSTVTSGVLRGVKCSSVGSKKIVLSCPGTKSKPKLAQLSFATQVLAMLSSVNIQEAGLSLSALMPVKRCASVEKREFCFLG